MSDDAEQTTENLSEESQPQEESNYSDVDTSTGGTDDNLRNFGGAIVVFALLALFGGQTFAWWGLEVSSDMGILGKMEITADFGTDNYYTEIGDVSEETSYGDKDLDFESVDGFFSTLKIMLYALVICGAGLAYMGHSGEKTEFSAKLIVVTGLLSLIILVYVFLSLPKAFDEDSTFFGDDDPAYFYSDESEGADTKSTFGLGMLLPLVSLGICGYMVKDRGITLEDITG